ncbi:MAG: antibiotic biosynthesis monooxygenase [Ponticaulis sp.]|mgnify:CR=1 FL=1|nr:antibiotic biosynthesis monooxygenase [Ponticaulis sp.]|tara:strand:- start:3880 stop:4170 length:291 start_codon:yes stop_codon:yes gene_type:complete
MYGLIGKFTSTEGKRDELIGYLLEGLQDMPGCLSYVVAKAPEDEVTIWVTEVWDTSESHLASLQLPQVQAAIAKARPMIAGMERLAETDVQGGVGI